MISGSFNIYFGLAVNGFFTGLGVVIANAFYDKAVKPHLKRINRIKKRFKKKW